MKRFRPDLKLITVGLLYVSTVFGLRDDISIDDLRKGNEPKSKIVRPSIWFCYQIKQLIQILDGRLIKRILMLAGSSRWHRLIGSLRASWWRPWRRPWRSSSSSGRRTWWRGAEDRGQSRQAWCQPDIINCLIIITDCLSSVIAGRARWCITPLTPPSQRMRGRW